MKRIALLVALAMLGTVSSFAAKPVPPAAPLGPLVVVDSTGKVLGRYSADSAGPTVFMTVGGSLVNVRLTPGVKLYFSFTSPVFFEDQNCQGAPYVPINQYGVGGVGVPTSVTMTDISSSKVTLYVASGDPTNRVLLSQLTPSGCELMTGPLSVSAWPLSLPVDLTAQYSPPFTIQ